MKSWKNAVLSVIFAAVLCALFLFLKLNVGSSLHFIAWLSLLALVLGLGGGWVLFRKKGPVFLICGSVCAVLWIFLPASPLLSAALFGIVFAFCITSIPYFYLRLSK